MFNFKSGTGGIHERVAEEKQSAFWNESKILFPHCTHSSHTAASNITVHPVAHKGRSNQELYSEKRLFVAGGHPSGRPFLQANENDNPWQPLKH
jgi:hypothetical protein